MKTYTCIYRDTSGAQRQAHIEAEDRAEVLRRLRDKGHVPVAVSEIHGLKTPALIPRLPVYTGRIVYPAAGTIILLLTLSPIWRVIQKRPESSPASANPLPDASISASAKASLHIPIRIAEKQIVTPNNLESPPESPSFSPLPNKAYIPSQTQIQKRYAEPDLSVSYIKQTHPAFYKTETEQLLSMMTSVPPGVEMPPLPVQANLDEDFNIAMSNTLIIDDKTSDEQAERLETVAWAKVQLSELVNQGWKPGEVLSELSKQHNENSVLRMATSLELKKMVEEKKFSDAELRSELKNINQQLSERGLPEITLDEIGIDEE